MHLFLTVVLLIVLIVIAYIVITVAAAAIMRHGRSEPAPPARHVAPAERRRVFERTEKPMGDKAQREAAYGELREIPEPGKDYISDRTVLLPWTAQAADLAPFPPPPAWTPSTAELDELKERFLAAQGGPVEVLPPDEHAITDEQFEQAKQDVIERYGTIPPSLQRVIDHGGRFARVHPDVKFNARPLLSDEDDEVYYLCAGCRNRAHCDGADEDCVCTCTWPADWDEEDENEEPDPFVSALLSLPVDQLDEAFSTGQFPAVIP